MGNSSKKRVHLLKHTGLLSLAFVAALSLTGVGYSSWQDTLSLDLSAKTGEFKPYIRAWKTSYNPSYSVEVKPSGNISITGTKVWPYSVCEVNYLIRNDGTIPIKYRINKNGIAAGGRMGVAINLDDVIIQGKGRMAIFEQDDDWHYLKPGESNEHKLAIHLADPLHSNITSNFTVPLEIVQWNAH